MTVSLMMALLLTALLLMLKPARAKAHCDTLDGPTAKDGLEALETGRVNLALKWVTAADEAQLREAFELSQRVQKLGADGKDLARRYFLDTLVRLHRASEGEGFTGLQPHGTPIDPKVAAADKAIATGSLAPLDGLFTDEEMRHLRHKYEAAMALKDYNPDDLPAARRYIAAYVDFFKLAEGEHHGELHGPHGGHEAHHAGH